MPDGDNKDYAVWVYITWKDAPYLQSVRLYVCPTASFLWDADGGEPLEVVKGPTLEELKALPHVDVVCVDGPADLPQHLLKRVQRTMPGLTGESTEP